MGVIRNTTELALAVCRMYADRNFIAVDATCGNGHDTLWLAEHFRHVYAFDIQQEAITNTKDLLRKNGVENVTLYCESHGRMKERIAEAPALILFNLGYLPGGDKNIATQKSETMNAVQGALDLLMVNGLLCITMYPGHAEGKIERDSILQWASALPKSVFHCVRTEMRNQPETAPEILWIEKKKAAETDRI